MNGEYIKALDDDRYYEYAIKQVKSVITKDLDYKKIADLCKTRIEVFPDIQEKLISLKRFLNMIPQCIRIRK